MQPQPHKTRPTLPTGIYVSPAMFYPDIVSDADGNLWIVRNYGHRADWAGKRPYKGQTFSLELRPSYWATHMVQGYPDDIATAHKTAAKKFEAARDAILAKEGHQS